MWLLDFAKLLVFSFRLLVISFIYGVKKSPFWDCRQNLKLSLLLRKQLFYQRLKLKCWQGAWKCSKRVRLQMGCREWVFWRKGLSQVPLFKAHIESALKSTYFLQSIPSLASQSALTSSKSTIKTLGHIVKSVQSKQ